MSEPAAAYSCGITCSESTLAIFGFARMGEHIRQLYSQSSFDGYVQLQCMECKYVVMVVNSYGQGAAFSQGAHEGYSTHI